MCLGVTKIAFGLSVGRRATGNGLRTTAVTSSVQGEFAIPKVSNFLRPSQFPRCPAPLLVRRDLGRSLTGEWADAGVRDVRYRFRGHRESCLYRRLEPVNKVSEHSRDQQEKITEAVATNRTRPPI